MVVTKLSILQDSLSSLTWLDLESMWGFGKDAAEFREWQATEQDPETMGHAEDYGRYCEPRDSEASKRKGKEVHEPCLPLDCRCLSPGHNGYESCPVSHWVGLTCYHCDGRLRHSYLPWLGPIHMEYGIQWAHPSNARTWVVSERGLPPILAQVLATESEPVSK